MVKIECDGCGASYQVDERRIPATGLRMRCPKCSKSLLVSHDGLVAAPTPAEEPPRRPSGASSELPAVFRSSTSAARPFGAIDVGAPPAVGANRHLSAHDLPVVQGAPGAAAVPPVRPRQKTMMGPGAFGRIELPPAVAASAPAEPRAASGGPRFDDVDLPTSAAASPPQDAAPGGGRSATRGFGDIDLPVFGGPPIAAGSRGGAFEAADLPAPTRGAFGSVDLPAPAGASDLPSVSRGMDLPSAARAADLPLPLRGADLPSVSRGTDLPSPSRGTDLPSPSRGTDLPSPSRGNDLPTAFRGTELPSISRGTDLPSVGGGAGLPMSAEALGLPIVGGTGLPSPFGGGLPSPQGAGLPTPQTAGLPSPHSSGGIWPAGPPSADRYGEEISLSMRQPEPEAEEDDLEGPEVGEELSLGLSPEKTRSALSSMVTAVAPAPPAAPKDGAIAHGSGLDAMPTHEEVGGESPRSITVEPVGGEMDLEPAVGEGAPPAAVPQEAPPVARPKKKGRRGRFVVAILVLLAIGGGSLALVPDIGPFGANFIADKLNEGDQLKALADLRASTQAALAEDTAAAADRALSASQAAHESAPRFRPITAYGAYAVYARDLRFGRRGEDETYAKQLLELIGPDAANEDMVLLAQAADDAAGGQLARARQTVASLQQKLPTDVDVAVLAGEIDLLAKAYDKAPATWKKAVDVARSARTLYGAARAAYAANDLQAASTFASEAIAASPKHAAARTLLATVLSRDPAHEQDAVKLLTEVTEDPEIRKLTSNPELVEAFTLLGRIHLSRSRMSAAETAFAAALKLEPQAVQALIGNGELFYRSGRFSEALSRFEAANRADADSVLAKVGAAKTWLALERMKEAKDLLKKLREAQPKEPIVAYWLGRTEDALGNRKDSEAAYLDAISIGGTQPEVVDAYVSLSQLLSGLGRADEASAKLAEATQKFPKSPALNRAKGEVLLASGHYEEARNEFKTALEIEEDLGTRFKLAVSQRRMRSFDDATKNFDAVAAIDPEYPGLALERGLLFEETGQTDKALEMYNAALQKAPNDVDMMLRVGATQVMAGHAEKAEPILKKVVNERPKSAEANHFYGRALLVMGVNLSEAMRYLEQATLIDPNRAEYFLYVGWGANESGQPAKATSALERALELDRNLGDAYWQRGVLLQKQGATLDALNDLRVALQKRPSRFEAYATMALCYQDQSKWADAEAAWRKAIAADGSVAEWHYRLGKILSRNAGSAMAELERAVTLATSTTRARPAWLFDAHFLYAEALRAAGDRDKAIENYRRFLELAPTDNAYRTDAEKVLEGWGVRVR